VVDFIDHCYDAEMVMWQDNALPPVPIRWYRAQPGAPLYKPPCAFRSRLNDKTEGDDDSSVPEIGETAWYNPGYYNGLPPAIVANGPPHGPDQAAQFGGLLGVDEGFSTAPETGMPSGCTFEGLTTETPRVLLTGGATFNPVGARVFVKRFMVSTYEFQSLDATWHTVTDLAGPVGVSLPAKGEWQVKGSALVIIAGPSEESQFAELRLYNVTADVPIDGSTRRGAFSSGLTAQQAEDMPLGAMLSGNAGDQIVLQGRLAGFGSYTGAAVYGSEPDGLSGLLFELIAPAPVVPAAVPSLTATETTPGTVLVVWPATQDADAYRVERSTDGVDYADIAGTSFVMYQDSGLSPDTTYYYRVRGVNGDPTYGPYSPVATIHTRSST